MGDFFWFSDTQWARIEPLLPTDVRGKPRVDDRHGAVISMDVASPPVDISSVGVDRPCSGRHLFRDMSPLD